MGSYRQGKSLSPIFSHISITDGNTSTGIKNYNVLSFMMVLDDNLKVIASAIVIGIWQSWFLKWAFRRVVYMKKPFSLRF